MIEKEESTQYEQRPVMALVMAGKLLNVRNWGEALFCSQQGGIGDRRHLRNTVGTFIAFGKRICNYIIRESIDGAVRRRVGRTVILCTFTL